MKTLDEFFSAIRAKATSLETGEQRAWYRGLGNKNHTLLPSLFRKPTGRPRERVTMERVTREKNLFARFTTEAGQLLPPGLESEWEVLSVMQHHGVPTRIMDWTTSLFVALYFALEYKDDSPSPCIWVLNPFKLNDEAVGKKVIFDRVDHLPKDAYKEFIVADADRRAAADTNQMKWPPHLPVATAPIWGHPRALRQHGVFTIHGTDERALEEQRRDLVAQVEIPRELQDSLRELLREAGIHHYSVFPDLDGLARRLRQRYGWT